MCSFGQRINPLSQSGDKDQQPTDKGETERPHTVPLHSYTSYDISNQTEMLTGWQYRLFSAIGGAVLTAVALLIANHPFTQAVFTNYVPLFWRLEPTILTGQSLRLAMLVSVIFVGAALVPLYKPRPRRILDIIVTTQKRTIIAGLGLATVGYFEWSHRLPRATLTMTIGVLAAVLPLWFMAVRLQTNGDAHRAIIVGDDMAQIKRIIDEVDVPVLGYLCPPSAYPSEQGVAPVAPAVADGSGDPRADGRTFHGLKRLGGLSKLEGVFVNMDIDTAILAFHASDRGEFFGTLDTCQEHGVNAKVHRDYADDVLTASDQVGTFVDVDIEPWDPQDYLLKRVFDVIVAGSALLVLAPLILLIVIALTLERKGGVFFTQERTYLFGETFTIRKFRTLIPKEGGEVGTVIDEDRRTTLGEALRTTHLDEIPQLWSILIGDMSVVGPRPAQTELEPNFENEAVNWRKRWFVKPGLTGLAQINNATSQEPQEKIRYDLRYIRNQSLTFDIKILIRQFWLVFVDTASLLGGRSPEK